MLRWQLSVVCSGILIAALILAACSPGASPAAAPTKPAEAAKPADAAKPAQTAAGAPKRGGQLNVVVQNDWVSFDPPFNTAEPNGSNMVFGAWMHWLQDTGGKWGPQPDMIAEWDQKPESLTL